MEEMQRRREELDESIRKFHEERSDSKKEIEKLQKQYDKASAEEKASADAEQEKRRDHEKTSQVIRKIEGDLSFAREKLIKNQAALESLRNITERYEGYGNTIKEVMKLRDNQPKIHGVVADIIRTKKQYETAVKYFKLSKSEFAHYNLAILILFGYINGTKNEVLEHYNLCKNSCHIHQYDIDDMKKFIDNF